MAKVGPENAPVNLESEMETMKIEKLTMDHVDKVFQFMIKEYCSDEPVPDCMLSKSVLSNVYGMQFFEWMEYTEDLTFGHCEGNNGRIYEGVVLGK